MSCSYADGLSSYHDKGKLGLAEVSLYFHRTIITEHYRESFVIFIRIFQQFDDAQDVQKKVKVLADWINQSKHAVIHTGAGISTSAGIPDFR